MASSHEVRREALEFYYLLQLQRVPRRVRPSLDNHDRGGCLLPLLNSLWQQSWFRSAMRRNNQSNARFREIKRHHRSYLAPIFVDFGWRERPHVMLGPKIGVRVFPLLSAEDLLCVDALLHRSRRFSLAPPWSMYGQGARAAGVFSCHCTCRLISVQAFSKAALATVDLWHKKTPHHGEALKDLD